MVNSVDFRGRSGFDSVMKSMDSMQRKSSHLFNPQGKITNANVRSNAFGSTRGNMVGAVAMAA